MKKRKYLLGAICILTASFAFGNCSAPNRSGRMAEIPSRTRADVIQIDVLKEFGRLEKPPVEFLHDVHTQALAKKNMGCTVCHLTQNGHIDPKFERIKDTGEVTVTNIYHQRCISCHGEMAIANENTGPVECNGCHTEKPRFSSSRQPMGFDKSLHFRHLQALDNKCERCHHDYNAKTKTLFYAKGQQESCRYCHKSETEGNRISMRLASHQACIGCHRKYKAQDLTAGPVECAGCHDPAAQQKIRKIAFVPRLKDGQPDFVLIKSTPTGNPAGIERLNSMNCVPFDHKAHEAYAESCRECHHESLKPCIDCHTLAGTKQGGGVTLEEAMHKVGTDRSCQGCHFKQLRDKKCAGCHDAMGTPKANREASCSPCHMRPVPGKGASGEPGQDDALAAEMLHSRTPVDDADFLKGIPETVVIKSISKRYGAVVFPHRRIVDALEADIRASKLATYFLTQPGTVCLGCHHNSAVSKKPPRCESCHGQRFDARHPLESGIKGAYHLQCMGCHKAMGIKKPAGCTDCHKKRTKSQASSPS